MKNNLILSPSKTKKKLKGLNYYSNLISSLILFSEANPKFALLMYSLLLPFKGKYIESNFKINNEGVFFLPNSLSSAERRLEWIIGQAETKNNLEILRPLLGWAHVYEKEMPKNIVVGIIGMAIPGPTLGLIKKKNPMSFLINKKALKNNLLIKEIAQAGVGLVSDIIKETKDLNKLDPDVYDWFFSDREFSIYKTNSKNLNEAYDRVKEMGVPVTCIKKEGELIGFATSPVLGTEFFSDFEEIAI